MLHRGAAVVLIPDSHEVVGLKGRRFYSINSVKAFHNLVAVRNINGA